MNDTYEDCIDDPFPISRAKALAEVKDHGANQFEFFDDLGSHDTYCVGAVLRWLGY